MVSPLLDVLFSAPLELNFRYSQELLGSNFFGINPKLETQISLDDYKKIPTLYDIAQQLDLSDAYNYIEKYFLS